MNTSKPSFAKASSDRKSDEEINLTIPSLFHNEYNFTK